PCVAGVPGGREVGLGRDDALDLNARARRPGRTFGATHATSRPELLPLAVLVAKLQRATHASSIGLAAMASVRRLMRCVRSLSTPTRPGSTQPFSSRRSRGSPTARRG